MNRKVVKYINLIPMLKKLPLIGLLLLWQSSSLAQSVGVQVNVLPPYQANLADYRSRPGQVVIILTNLTRSQQNIQLTGSIIGDNGVTIIAKPGYRSTQPIVLEAGEIKRVTAEEVAQLFDINALDTRNLNLREVARTGMLPEGMYQICIQALDYRTHQLLSADAPGGCSNLFPIQSLEPPVIIKPMPGEEINALIPQNLLFTWTTPPAAPPGVEYVFKVVELLDHNRNPNDAILSNTGINAFEEVVRGNNFLYGPGYAPLVEGRKYAVQVTARSPFNNAIFRNAGKSEVVVFTYGNSQATANNTRPADLSKNKAADIKYATHTIKGKLLWAFKESEESNTAKVVAANAQGLNNSQPGQLNAGSINKVGIQTAVTTYYAGNNTLQISTPLKLTTIDPTLNVAPLLNLHEQPVANEFINATGAEQVSYTQAAVSGKISGRQHPLAGVTITIKAENNAALIAQSKPQNTTPTAGTTNGINDKIKTQLGLRTGSSLISMLDNTTTTQSAASPIALSGAQRSLLKEVDQAQQQPNQPADSKQSVLLATGITANDGSYTIQFLHPEYEGLGKYTHLVITAKTEDFEEKEFRIPLSDFNLQETIDLGTRVLPAKTYRYLPTLNLEKGASGTIETSTFTINLYRPLTDIQQYSYLQQEGIIKGTAPGEKIINGRKMRLVASQQITAGAGSQSAPIFTALFYTGKLYVTIEPVKGNYQRRETDIAVQDLALPATTILEAGASYLMRLVSPSIAGQVIAKGGAGMEPIANAIVKVTFNPDDVEWSMNDFLNTGLLANAMRTGSTQLASYTGAGSAGPTPNNNVGLFAAAARNSQSGITTPVMITNSNSLQGALPVVTPVQNEKQYGAYSAITDAAGQFYIGNLPILKEGKSYTITLLELPKQYQDMEVAPATKQHTFMISKGEQVIREFVVKPEVFQLIGRVVDKNGKALPFARLHFKGSSTYIDAGESGLFETSYFAGSHTLVIEKQGYVQEEVRVNISKQTQVASNNNQRATNLNKESVNTGKMAASSMLTMDNSTQWVQQVKSSPSVVKATQGGQAFTPALFGHATPDPKLTGASLNSSLPLKTDTGNDETALYFLPLVVNNFRGLPFVEMNKDIQDLGDIGYLSPRTGKITFRVTDKKSGAAIAGATISLFDITQVTNQQGISKYEGLGGQATVRVTPPAAAGYLVLETSLLINETGVENTVVLKLEKGVRVTGRVTSGDKPVPNTGITPEGYEAAKITTDTNGNYELYIPAGTITLKAARSGYITQSTQATIAADKENIVNFVLKDGGNKKITHLLGFEIELEKAVAEGNGELWTGRFVNLQPTTSAFSLPAGNSLAFTNVKVTFDASGNPIPQNNEVPTDVVNLPVKLFGYLPLTFTANGGLKVKAAADGKGYIAGSLKLSTQQLPNNRGFKWLETAEGLFVVPHAETAINNVRLFNTASAEQQAYDQFKFMLPLQTSYTIDLYGFKTSLDLAASRIYADRLQLAGTLTTAALGPVAEIKLSLQELIINKNLQIQSVKFKSDNLPKLDIAGWGAEIHSLLFNEGRFKLGGKLTVSIPSSGTSHIQFSDLSLMADALYGGNFSFPDKGINLLNIVQLKSKNAPLHFGRVGNTNVYSLNGSAVIQFDQFITKKIDIPLFQVQTDGRFMIESPANFTTDVGFAQLAVQGIAVNTGAGQTPGISILGEFKSDLSMLKFTAGDIRFKAKAGGGTEFSVSKIGAELDVPVFKAGLTLAIKDNGFEGAGAMGVPGTPINADIAFHYYKTGNNLDIGASFKSGLVIPLGIVTIEKVGGGFRYETAGKKFMVNINGAASITGFGNLVRLNPISLTVESGPVIRGSADLEVVSYFKLAKSEIVLNIPGKQFAVTINSDIEPIRGLYKSQLRGLFRLSWNPSDPYAFLGCGMNTGIAGIFNSYGNFALGINVKNPYTRQDDIGYYFSKLDKDLAGSGTNTFSGVYIHTGFQIGNPAKKYGFDITVASAQFWYSSSTEAMLLCNFANNSQYRMRLKGDLSAGAALCAAKVCVGASFNACYAITGGRNEADGWYIDGRVAGAIGVHLGGCDPACNEITTCLDWPPAGARVCANAQAHIAFTQKDGWKLSGSAGGDPAYNGCNQ